MRASPPVESGEWLKCAREKYNASRVHNDPCGGKLRDAGEMAWNRFATNTGLVRSLCAVTCAPARPLHSLCLLSNRGPDKKTHSRPENSGDPY